MEARTGCGIACALGVLGGVLIGGRAVKTYDWRTEWTILAPMPVVYQAMISREAVREWWPGTCASPTRPSTSWDI